MHTNKILFCIKFNYLFILRNYPCSFRVGDTCINNYKNKNIYILIHNIINIKILIYYHRNFNT